MLQNMHLKQKMTKKTVENGNFKHYFSCYYDFAFTNLLKTEAEQRI
jgi:hypothetical protein